ncbi:Uncharacterised protein [Neisseria meningitidis]|nr:Uncharacterised protein [Neisseria meningitidis]
MTGFEIAGIYRENSNLSSVIPTKVGIQFVEFQSFLINSCSFEFLDSRFCGNDAGRVLVFSDKFNRNLKSRHSRARVFVRTDPSFPRRRESGPVRTETYISSFRQSHPTPKKTKKNPI